MHTWLEVDLKAIRENFLAVKEKVGKRKVLVCVKADGYGHGIVEVSRFLEREGVDFLGVARWEEGAELRESGIKTPILILGSILPEDVNKALKYRLRITVGDEEIIERVEREVLKSKVSIPLHLKVDTGMGRIGAGLEEAKRLASLILEKSLFLEGIFTHFPSAEDDEEFTLYQIKTFNSLVKELEEKGCKIPYVHMANSAGVLNFPSSYADMVRPGIMIYGYYPSPQTKKSVRLTPSLTWKTKVVFIKKVDKGKSVSYGRTYYTHKPCKILTLSVGYGDGYSRYLSNRGEVLIKGKKFPVVGRVCMDQIMVEVDRNFPVNKGEEVILMGKDLGVEDIAERINSIPHEVVVRIGKRVKRVYRNG